MTVAEFKKLCGEAWDRGFDDKLVWAARKLYQQLYGKLPPTRRDRFAGRNKVTVYPCGVIEQAYREIRAAGVPFAGRISESARAPTDTSAG